MPPNCHRRYSQYLDSTPERRLDIALNRRADMHISMFSLEPVSKFDWEQTRPPPST